MKRQKLIGLIFLAILFMSSFPTVAASTVPLKDRVELTSYSYTAVDVNSAPSDYMIDGKLLYTTMSEKIYAGDGETSAGSGTSYLDLSQSCLLGDYANRLGSAFDISSWSDFAFVQPTYSTSETEAGDTAADSITDPSLSAGDTDTYISATVDWTTASVDAGTASETVYWDAEVWYDGDGDGTDDSSTTPAEDYIPFTKNVYIYAVMKIDCSDIDKQVTFTLSPHFYVDAATTYAVDITLIGGSGGASSYTHEWVYTGATSAQVKFYEAEDDWVVVLIDLAELISDDTDSSPNIAGLDYIRFKLVASDDYGDNSSDTVTAYLRNFCIFNDIPALTDRSASTRFDINGDTTNTATGDASYYTSHDILQPYTAAATDNAWNSKIYLDNDIVSGTQLLLNWHQITFAGKAWLDPSEISVNTQLGQPPNKRDVSLTFDFNQLRISDNDEISSTFAPSYGTAAFYITTDKDDFYSDAKDFDEDIISAEVSGVDVTDDFKTALANVDDDTDVALYTWSSTPTNGKVEVKYSYWTAEQEEVGAADWAFFANAVSFLGQNIYIVAAVSITIIALVALAFYKPKN